jgi:hypothetical protein
LEGVGIVPEKVDGVQWDWGEWCFGVEWVRFLGSVQV